MPDKGKIERRKARWYFGGLASTAAVCLSHPFDLVKVHIQTEEGKLSVIEHIPKIAREQGLAGFYNGVSASFLRQITYSTVRFGVYEIGSEYLPTETFFDKIKLAALGGIIGGAVGTPTEKINVRMQNDFKLPPSLRRNYKNVSDGLIKVYRNEGVNGLFNAVHVSALRGSIVNVGQIGCYKEAKAKLLQFDYFTDDLLTHFLASLFANTVNTCIVQPFDVIKTRVMSAKPRPFSGVWDAFLFTAHQGPFAFYRGFVPYFIRGAPIVILTFIFYEQLRLNFGYIPE